MLLRLESVARFSIAFLLLVTATRAQASCGAAFCTFNASWETQGAWTEPGMRLDLRFEYIGQDQPRHATDKVAVGQVSRHHDEVKTINRNTVVTLDYTLTPEWGVSLQAPFVERAHSHIHNHQGAKLPERWDISGLGDTRILARRRYLTSEAGHDAWGITWGLKLPTGDTDKTNAANSLAERTLQPGSGTTDVIVGVFYNTLLFVAERPTAAFVQGTIQAPLKSHDQFRPGNQLGLDAGIRYPLSQTWHAMLQTNILFKLNDEGTNAEPVDSGGTFAWVSPGLGYAINRHWQIYGFAQLPLYQRVNGVQLTADWTASMGMSWRF